MNSRKRMTLNRGCLDWLYTDYNHIMAPHKAMSQEILPMALCVDTTRRKMNSTSASQDKYPHYKNILPWNPKTLDMLMWHSCQRIPYCK